MEPFEEKLQKFIRQDGQAWSVPAAPVDKVLRGWRQASAPRRSATRVPWSISAVVFSALVVVMAIWFRPPADHAHPAKVQTVNVQGHFTSIGSLGSIQNVDMVSSQDGWALTNKVVLRTVNGGGTWVRTSGLPGNTVLVSGWFFSTQQAIVEAKSQPGSGTGTLYATSDGGRTWRQLGYVPSNTVVQQFLDPTHGWAQQGSKVIRTTDGGQSWQEVFSLPQGGAGTGSLGWIRFSTSQDGTLLWFQTGAPGFWAMHSVDGGQNWTPQKLPVLNKTGFTLVTNLQPPVFWGNEGAMSGWEDGRLITYHTNNGGDSWTVVGASGIQPTPPNTFVGNPNVTWTSAQVGWLGPMVSKSGKGYLLYRSADGGRTWSVTTRFSGLDWSVSASLPLRFVKQADGWLLITRQEGAQYELWQTTDGGQHWRTTTFSHAR